MPENIVEQHGEISHRYPHQVVEEVGVADLADDFAANPEAYHPNLHSRIGLLLDEHNGTEPVVVEQDAITRTGDIIRLNIDEVEERLYSSGEILGNSEAHMLLKYAMAFAIVDHIKRFRGLDQYVLAELCQESYGDIVLDNLDVFADLDMAFIVSNIIRAGDTRLAVRYLEGKNMPDSLRKTVVEELGKTDPTVIMRSRELLALVDHTEITLHALEKGETFAVFDNLDKLQGLDRHVLFQKLLDMEQFYTITSHKYLFAPEDISEFAAGLRENGNYLPLLRLGEELPADLDPSQLFLTMIDQGATSEAARLLCQFSELDPLIARRLLDAGELEVVYSYGRFTSFDMEYAIQKALQRDGRGRVLLEDMLYMCENLSADIADQIADRGDPRLLSEHLKRFSSISEHALRHIIRGGFGQRLIPYLELHPEVDRNMVAEELTRVHDGPSILFANMDLFSGYDLQNVFDEALSRGNIYSTLRSVNIDQLPEAHRSKFASLAAKSAEGLLFVLQNLRLRSAVGEDVIFEWVLGSDSRNVMREFLERQYFVGVDMDRLRTKLMTPRFAAEAMQWQDKIPGIDIGEVTDLCVQSGYYGVIVRSLKTLEGLRPEIAELLISERYGAEVLNNIDSFRDLDLKNAINTVFMQGDLRRIPESMRGLIEPDGFAQMMDYYIKSYREADFAEFRDAVLALSADRQPPVFRAGVIAFGSTINQASLALMEALFDESKEIPSELTSLGVTERGMRGAEQVRDAMTQFISDLREVKLGEHTQNLLITSRLHRDIFRSVVRYDASEWGDDKSDENLVSTLAHAVDLERSGAVGPVRSEYVPSDIFDVTTLAGAKEKPQWTQDLLERYSALRLDMQAATDILESDSLAGMFTGMRVEVGMLIEELNTQIMAIDQEASLPEKEKRKAMFRMQNLNKKRDSLQTFLDDITDGRTERKRFIMNSPEDFSKAFVTLSPYDGLHSAMRKVVFSWALRKNPDYIPAMKNLSASPSMESMSALRKFIEHIVNQSTYKDYFEGNDKKKAASDFRQMTSTRALEEGMKLYQERLRKKGQEQIQFVPTRGIMMEFSGDIGDACWTQKYPSIAQEMPNMTAVIMKRQPGTSKERFVGSALLIETSNSQTGEKVLVLRGTNPTENYINKVKVEDFFEAITSYVKEIAQRRGMIPAITIDDHSGGAGTNRPALYGYLESLLKGEGRLKSIRVADRDTYFNGYDITHDTYALPV